MNKFRLLSFIAALSMLFVARPEGRATTTIAQPLVKTIAEVCVKDAPTAKDFARIAQSTVDFGRRMLQSKEQIPREVIASGLDSVDIGERMDAKTENWSKLREELQQLLKEDPRQSPPPDQPPKNDDQQGKENEKNGQAGGDQNPSSRDEKKSPDDKKGEAGSSSQPENKSSQEDPSTSPKNSPSSEDAKPPNQQNAPSAFGDMKDSHEPPVSQRQPPDPLEIQKVGGQVSKSESRMGSEDPQLIIPLQKLEQLRDLDSPAKLFRAIEGSSSQPTDKKGKNW